MSISAPPLTDRSARWHVPVEDKKGLAQLRRDWRMVAIRQWFRGTKLAAILFFAMLFPAFVFYFKITDGDPRVLNGVVYGLGLIFLGPAATVALTLIALSGASGTARLDDLKTIPGGPTEWNRALLISARNAARVVFLIWGIAASLRPSGFDIDPLLAMLIFPNLYLWTTQWIVSATRFTVKTPALGGIMVWVLSLWPMGVFMIPSFYACACMLGPIELGIMLVSPFAYLCQCIVARRKLHEALSLLSLAAE